MSAPVRPLGENSGPLSQINDPPGQELNIQSAVVKLSADFGKLTAHLGRVCKQLPIPDARKNRDLPGSSPKGQKRCHSVSSSDFEEDSSPRHKKTSKDDIDAISVTASEEDVDELLLNSSESAATIDSQTDVNDQLLIELSAGLIDNEKKGRKVTKQQKYSQLQNCSDVTVTRVNPEIWAPLNAAQRKTELRMANLQQVLQKATFATVMATEKLLGMKNDPKNTSLQYNELITKNVDVVALLGHADHGLSNLRREKLKSALSQRTTLFAPLRRSPPPLNIFLATISPNSYGMPKKQIALEMPSARQSTTTDQFTETPRGLTGVATLTKVGLQTGSIFRGKIPIERYGKSATTAKRKAEEIQQLNIQPKNSVSDFPLFIEATLRLYLQSRCDTFQAGNISHSLDAWKGITSDKDILFAVMGTSIEFCDKPTQHYLTKSVRSEREIQIIFGEINKLLSKGVLEVTDHRHNEIISDIFLSDNKDDDDGWFFAYEDQRRADGLHARW